MRCDDGRRGSRWDIRSWIRRWGRFWWGSGWSWEGWGARRWKEEDLENITQQKKLKINLEKKVSLDLCCLVFKLKGYIIHYTNLSAVNRPESW